MSESAGKEDTSALVAVVIMDNVNTQLVGTLSEMKTGRQTY